LNPKENMPLVSAIITFLYIEKLRGVLKIFFISILIPYYYLKRVILK